MILRFSSILVCMGLLAGCFTRRTEEVTDPALTEADGAANGSTADAANGSSTDAAGDAASTSTGMNDAMVIIPCAGDSQCTRADSSV